MAGPSWLGLHELLLFRDQALRGGGDPEQGRVGAAAGTGSDTAGWPVRLYGPVNRLSPLSSPAPNGGSRSGA